MKKTIRDYDLNNKKVIIRCDFNVPIKDGKIIDDNRIVQSLTTIKYAIDGGAKVILMSHLGRIKEEADKVVKNMQENNYARFSLAGVVVIDADWLGKKICGVPVVANAEELPMYVCQEWIDEVLVVISEQLPYPEELIDKLTETGVTVHLNLAKITNKTGKRQFVEKVGEYTVLTTSLNYASAGQLLLKRLMDIFGGLVGCILQFHRERTQFLASEFLIYITGCYNNPGSKLRRQRHHSPVTIHVIPFTR